MNWKQQHTSPPWPSPSLLYQKRMNWKSPFALLVDLVDSYGIRNEWIESLCNSLKSFAVSRVSETNELKVNQTDGIHTLDIDCIRNEWIESHEVWRHVFDELALYQKRMNWKIVDNNWTYLERYSTCLYQKRMNWKGIKSQTDKLTFDTCIRNEWIER